MMRSKLASLLLLGGLQIRLATAQYVTAVINGATVSWLWVDPASVASTSQVSTSVAEVTSTTRSSTSSSTTIAKSTSTTPKSSAVASSTSSSISSVVPDTSSYSSVVVVLVTSTVQSTVLPSAYSTSSLLSATTSIPTSSTFTTSTSSSISAITSTTTIDSIVTVSLTSTPTSTTSPTSFTSTSTSTLTTSSTTTESHSHSPSVLTLALSISLSLIILALLTISILLFLRHRRRHNTDQFSHSSHDDGVYGTPSMSDHHSLAGNAWHAASYNPMREPTLPTLVLKALSESDTSSELHDESSHIELGEKGTAPRNDPVPTGTDPFLAPQEPTAPAFHLQIQPHPQNHPLTPILESDEQHSPKPAASAANSTSVTNLTSLTSPAGGAYPWTPPIRSNLATSYDATGTGKTDIKEKVEEGDDFDFSARSAERKNGAFMGLRRMGGRVVSN